MKIHTDSSASNLLTLQQNVARLATAPHRLLFFIGASNVLLAMAWWSLWLIDARWQLFGLKQPSMPAGWMHAIIMQYSVLPPFIFGFLLTVFPRWLNLPALTKWHYLPIGLGLLGGQLLILAGMFGFPLLVLIGLFQITAGWAAGLIILFNVYRQSVQTVWHAISMLVALALGLIGLLLIISYGWSGNAELMFAAIKLGTFALLLPIYFTVCHRMLPFFASCVLKDYRVYRPMWSLALFWVLALIHLGLEITHLNAWLWLPDSVLIWLSIHLLWRWWPRESVPPLMRVLLLGFAWLPIAMLLYSAQSIYFLATDQMLLGRAPAHALFIGFFGSLLVAMVTRVTQGHSGRPLQLGWPAGFAFVMIQVVVVFRIFAEISPDYLTWQSVSALLWLCAFLPWVLRSTSIYLTPRADGQEG
ncbi:MAG: NnrS family protein [Arenimonas sp.]|nr:NnrS family protein [Arenimonas sp.]